MFMASHSSDRRRPVLIALAASLLLLGFGLALGLR
jgi:hypothetical protein